MARPESLTYQGLSEFASQPLFINIALQDAEMGTMKTNTGALLRLKFCWMVRLTVTNRSAVPTYNSPSTPCR
jgi:hypothetical protein